LAFTPNGHQIVSTGFLRSGGGVEVKTWDATPRE
jgi:hypothetical protein